MSLCRGAGRGTAGGAIEELRRALLGLAERQLPGDSLPCFWVDRTVRLHDVWCEDARAALADPRPRRSRRRHGTPQQLKSGPGLRAPDR